MQWMEFKAYRRSFARGYASASDRMAKREGAIVMVKDRTGRLGFGEAAPLESFGTESFPALVAKLAELQGEFEYERALPKLAGYPCARFAVESALAMLEGEDVAVDIGKPWAVCGLAMDLRDAAAFEKLLDTGYRCVKFKVGLGDPEEERRRVGELAERAEGRAAFRLDANGSLSAREAARWLERMVEWPVEFLEQPLAKGQDEELRRLAEDFPRSIALDESVCRVDDLKRWRDEHWQGALVVKPLVSGSYRLLKEELANPGPEGERLVFSSALETKIGAWAAIGLAAGAKGERESLGFGVDRLFGDEKIGLEPFGHLQRDGLPRIGDCESLWNLI